MFPVWGEYDGRRDYSCDVAPVVLAERAEGPAVPVLVASNDGKRPVLMLEGQLLEGGWQNRVLTRSYLLGAGSTVDLEVACVEANRWGGRQGHRADRRRGSIRVRSALSRSPQQNRQGEVWRRVSEYDARYGPDPTSSFTGHLDRAMPDVSRLVDDLRALQGQSGVVIGIGGQPAMAEVFDSPATLRQELGSILAAAGMDAVDADPVPTPSRRARRFLDRAAKVAFVEGAPAGMGPPLVAAASTSRRPGSRGGTDCCTSPS